MVAISAEDQGFPFPGCHHALPERFALGPILELPYMMDLEWPLRCSTVFTLLSAEAPDYFRAAQRPDVESGQRIERWVGRGRLSKVFQPEHSNSVGLVRSLTGECIS